MNRTTHNRAAKLEARTAALVGAVANGELTPSQADALSKPVDGFTRALHVEDLDRRLTLLEAKP